MTSLLNDIDDLGHLLKKVPNCDVLENHPLSGYTSYGIGGNATLLVKPQTEPALMQTLKLVHVAKVPLFIMGHGSNILVSDKGWPGVVLYFGRNFSGWRFEEETAIVKSGTPLMDLIRAAVARGLSGMEQMAGIPGSVGGALRMNAGAFGQEIQNVIQIVYGYRTDGTPVSPNQGEISFGYRSAPELNDIVISGGRFQFMPEGPARLLHRMEEILALRAKNQPLDHPSCGSVFKRPRGYYAGVLIEGANMKGVRIGDAMVSPKHSGFIVNLGKASAQQIYRLITLIEERVWERFGVRLEREVRLIGEFDEE